MTVGRSTRANGYELSYLVPRAPYSALYLTFLEFFFLREHVIGESDQELNGVVDTSFRTNR